MSNYSFSDDAVRDLDDICEYIARNNFGAASKLFDRIRERCKAVADFPNSVRASPLATHVASGDARTT